MLLVLTEADGRLTSSEPTLWRRVLARGWCANSLDRQLAAGASPEASELLALRAEFIVRPSERRRLAHAIVGIVEEATTGSSRLNCSRVPVCTKCVCHVADAMWALVDRLLLTGPVPARGVALVRVLLTDGTGPLFYGGSDPELRRAVEAALSGLDPLYEW